MNTENPSTAVPPKYVRAREVAEHLGISEALLSKYRQTGSGPPYYQPGGVGTAVLYRLDEVEAWVEGGAEVEAIDGDTDTDTDTDEKPSDSEVRTTEGGDRAPIDGEGVER